MVNSMSMSNEDLTELVEYIVNKYELHKKAGTTSEFLSYEIVILINKIKERQALHDNHFS